jgi:hypothetical protein
MAAHNADDVLPLEMIKALLDEYVFVHALDLVVAST